MELEQILALLDRFDASSATGLRLELGEMRLELEKGSVPAAAPALAADAPHMPHTPASPAGAPAEEAGALVKAPLVGTFYAAPAPGEAPFVKVGDRVRKGQTLCVLEAMKMMSEVPAPMDCVVLQVLAKDGDLVGFDAPLYRVDPLSE